MPLLSHQQVGPDVSTILQLSEFNFYVDPFSHVVEMYSIGSEKRPQKLRHTKVTGTIREAAGKAKSELAFTHSFSIKPNISLIDLSDRQSTGF